MWNYRKSYAGQARIAFINHIVKDAYRIDDLRAIRVEVDSCQRKNGALVACCRVNFMDGHYSPWVAFEKPDNAPFVNIVAWWDNLFGTDEGVVCPLDERVTYQFESERL